MVQRSFWNCLPGRLYGSIPSSNLAVTKPGGNCRPEDSLSIHRSRRSGTGQDLAQGQRELGDLQRQRITTIEPIPNINNGWIYRFRIDYQLGPNTKIYGSYQQACDSQLAQGNGAHLYWTPGNAIPYPGGGESEAFRGKSLAGHFVHNFSASMTNDFMAAWAFGRLPLCRAEPIGGLPEHAGLHLRQSLSNNLSQHPCLRQRRNYQLSGLLAGFYL